MKKTTSHKKGKLDPATLSLLANAKRAHIGKSEDLALLKMDVKNMSIGDYIEFDKRYRSAIREFQSRLRTQSSLSLKYVVYKHDDDNVRIARVK